MTQNTTDENQSLNTPRPVFSKAPVDERLNPSEDILFYAVRYGENDVINALWEKNSKAIHNKTPRQETVLHILSARDHKDELIQKAIDQGVDIDAVDVFGNTALHYACKNGQEKNVQVLLNAGASPLIWNRNKELAIEKLTKASSSDAKIIANIAILLSHATRHVYQKMKDQDYLKKIPASVKQSESILPTAKIITSQTQPGLTNQTHQQHTRA